MIVYLDEKNSGRFEYCLESRTQGSLPNFNYKVKNIKDFFSRVKEDLDYFENGKIEYLDVKRGILILVKNLKNFLCEILNKIDKDKIDIENKVKH